MKSNHTHSRQYSGIRLNFMNMLLISIGLVLAVLMVISTYQTAQSIREIVSVTDTYLVNQQIGGMMEDFSEDMEEAAKAFISSGEAGMAHRYAGLRSTIGAQLAQYRPESSNSEAANQALQEAIDAFQKRGEMERQAMRTSVDTAGLPPAALAALPDFLRETELSGADQGLSPETRKSLAMDRLNTAEYARYGETIRIEVGNSHRLSSQEGQKQANETAARVNGILTEQMVLVFLFIFIAAAALLLNRFLIIAPIQRSVDNLDRREPIPEQGSFEMRRMARAYNEVLKENLEKEEALSYAATHDTLTGTLNRTAFDLEYQKARSGQVAVLVADIDHFKHYNDEYGHDIGDRVLQKTGNALKKHFREEDRICRIGGDEFCVILPGISQDQAEGIRDRIIRINGELKRDTAGAPPVSISAGVACWDRPDAKGDLFKDADQMLLGLKKSRDNCCAIYPG